MSDERLKTKGKDRRYVLLCIFHIDNVMKKCTVIIQYEWSKGSRVESKGEKGSPFFFIKNYNFIKRQARPPHAQKDTTKKKNCLL